jgi:hypothetical protein
MNQPNANYGRQERRLTVALKQPVLHANCAFLDAYTYENTPDYAQLNAEGRITDLLYTLGGEVTFKVDGFMFFDACSSTKTVVVV